MRKLENWITAYSNYTEDTESTKLFNKWVGISTVASALRKKAWLDLGRLKVYPNLYIVLVAEPGIARKSQAITYANEIITNVPSIKVSADSITPQALLQDLEDATTYEMLEGGRMFRHASLSVISKEFESFLGNAATSSKMMVTLTDLFDAGETPWKHRTKSSGSSTIPSVFLNILGATTPQSLASCLSELAVGGGLTSRILFVFADRREKRIAFPAWSDELEVLKQDLTHDLQEISGIVGAFEFTQNAKEFWENWYAGYDDTKAGRIQPRWEFDGWYSRKPLLIQKVAICLSASEDSNRLIGLTHLKQAIADIESVEGYMGSIYSTSAEHGVVIEESNVLLKLIKQYKRITEKQLMHLVWRDIDEEEFDRLIAYLIKSKKCLRTVEETNGHKDVWYSFREFSN